MLTIKLSDMKKLILWTLLIVPFALAAQEAESAQKVLPVKWES